ncbi:aldehyde dehydrogenase (NADP(+)) [Burkholderia pseudomultivorans]|uniref:aldehyde dehydrogenase (NADP(+)) n=1 Tax=Burkholderia pseudomultivorans TaxID=1207504 RepID=UPI0007538354|nr:aldehyde dehydrogenase (NADP(+)) [Burkholderia pseudomultivorans]KVC25239.1 2,5-dioxovalerate dehydrogenase [Burkholderia pseudomultivorans]KVC27514.1 2,5-dioxovalerate dehydrogenase [Burkholderia pseudomultivorans]
MQISGASLIGQRNVAGAEGFRAIDPATGATLEPVFGRASPQDVDDACRLAAQAFDAYRNRPLDARASFLDAIAEQLLALGDALIERCVAESGLPRARIEGERGRTIAQLRMFAQVVRDGAFLGARVDPAQPARQPLPRADLRLQHVALGPVAVFGASNFPLAFSVAGGDTAAALAAGCPVVVKAHPAHPGTSALVGQAIRQAVHACGMPDGTFSLLFDDGHQVGAALVGHPQIQAVGFTGSRTGGVALMALAAARRQPIPVYAEMSSVNPVLLFPHALEARAEAIGRAFAASLTLGTGQFCTNPGLIVGIDGPALRRFEAAAAAALADTPATAMLTPGIQRAYDAAVERLAAHRGVERLAQGATGGAVCHAGRAALFATKADAFARDAGLHDEVFGPASLVVRCPDLDAMHALVDRLDGQLTVALHLDEADRADARLFMPLLERRAGRILVNGFGTGVEVAHAMVHGGPYPATSDGRSTSVGSLAIARFLRPVCYQDVPDALLPDALRDANPLNVPRSVDGRGAARG